MLSRSPIATIQTIANAIAKGNGNLACSLLQRERPDPNLTLADKGYSLLHLAAARDLPEVCALLVEQGADPKLNDDDGNTPLHVAAGNGAVDAIKVLLRFGADIKDDNNQLLQALDIALLEQQRPAARALIEAGADIDHGLSCAMEEGSLGAMDLAIDLGAGRQTTALASVFSRISLNHEGPEQAPFADLLLRRDPTLATTHFNLEFTRRLDGPQRPNSALPDLDTTLLHRAVIDGQAVLVHSLLLAGADPRQRNSCQETAVDVAAESAIKGLLLAWRSRVVAQEALHDHDLSKTPTT